MTDVASPAGIGEPADFVPPPWLLDLVARVERTPAAELRFVAPTRRGSRSVTSAVLVLFGPGKPDAEVILTERSHTLRSHPGQVSFPGGRSEPEDASASGTALREATEEIGLDPDGVSVLAELPAVHIPVSGYDVTPVLAWWHRPGDIRVHEPAEVAQVLRVPVAELIDPARRFRVRHPSGYTGPAFAVSSAAVDGLVVWGFTAGLLDRLFDLAGITREWDASVVKDVN